MAESAHSDASAPAAHGHGHDHGGHGHHDPREHEKHYWRIYWILLVLLVASVIGPFIGEATGIIWITLITAFGIAFVKAALVVKHFMHLNLEPKFVGYICATALALMALLFFWVAPDVMKHEGHQWVNMAAMRATGQTSGIEGDMPFDAEDTFQAVCASCHGEGGRGNGPASAALEPKPADFTSEEFWQERDREHVATVIALGGAAVDASPLMPAFGPTYTDEQIQGLVDYVMTFRPEEAIPEPRVEVGPGPDQPTEVENPSMEVDLGTEVPPVAEEAPAEEVAEAAPPAPPEMSEAEKARRAAFITQRLYR